MAKAAGIGYHGGLENLTMTEGLPLPYLVVPVFIALTAVAAMIGFQGAKTPRRLSTELGYKPEPNAALSMTPGRYVGGHPDLEGPVAKPHVVLTHRHLAAFARAWGVKLFAIPWNKIEAVSTLTRQQMEAAAIAVRGLRPGAIDAADPEARFVRVRYQDERGWWQNVILELAPAHAPQQAQEIESFWARYKDVPDPAPEPDAKAPATSKP
ncbi:hypothetical protein D3C72_562080 [compost metagenome]